MCVELVVGLDGELDGDHRRAGAASGQRLRCERLGCRLDPAGGDTQQRADAAGGLKDRKLVGRQLDAGTGLRRHPVSAGLVAKVDEPVDATRRQGQEDPRGLAAVDLAAQERDLVRIEAGDGRWRRPRRTASP